jgi:hypothetical protein
MVYPASKVNRASSNYLPVVGHLVTTPPKNIIEISAVHKNFVTMLLRKMIRIAYTIQIKNTRQNKL